MLVWTCIVCIVFLVVCLFCGSLLFLYCLFTPTLWQVSRVRRFSRSWYGGAEEEEEEERGRLPSILIPQRESVSDGEATEGDEEEMRGGRKTSKAFRTIKIFGPSSWFCSLSPGRDIQQLNCQEESEARFKCKIHAGTNLVLPDICCRQLRIVSQAWAVIHLNCLVLTIYSPSNQRQVLHRHHHQ